MSATKKDNIVLVGPMGVGKTTVGKLVADSLGRDFIDTDDMIEDVTGISIARIFSERSEAYFRSLEREVVQTVSSRKNLVVAAGGGMIVPEENFRDLDDNGILICLLASADVLADRIGGSNSRPLLHEGDRKEIIQSILDARMEAFSRIDHVIRTDSMPPSAVARTVVSIYRSQTDDV